MSLFTLALLKQMKIVATYDRGNFLSDFQLFISIVYVSPFCEMRMSTKIRDYQRETRDASSYSAGILRNRSFLLHFIVLMASVMDNLFHPLMVLLNGKSS